MDPISNEYDMVIKEIEDYMPECNVVRADVCSSQSSPSEGTCDGSIQYVRSEVSSRVQLGEWSGE